MITLGHIGVTYGSRRILDNLNLDFSDRCITAVMGPNGCGKTTLLRCIGGLLKPTSGHVLVDGRQVNEYAPRELAQRLAFVRQHAQTDFDFSAFEIVLMGRNPYQRRLQNESQADWDIVERCMRQTGTWHLRFSVPSQMSGGELQRVMIARALAQQTPILLMDEPVSNLDIAHQLEVMRLLRAATDKTILIVIHDLNLALQFCDRLLLLHDGKALYHGPIADGLTPDNIRSVYGVDTHISDRRIIFDY
ncbi:MAG: ABC transporter ATP-binding protein [Bacteroidales bacterium]|nr:ABC transporter ATP-binding protein [Bacteroidales bacterium]